jgi:hypothetical protein
MIFGFFIINLKTNGKIFNLLVWLDLKCGDMVSKLKTLA